MNASSDMSALRAPWGIVSLASGKPVRRTFGPRELWLQFVQGEIRLADRVVADPVEDGGDAPPPDETRDWSRWALPGETASRPLPGASEVGKGGGSSPSVVLRPALPDRPLIVQPEVPFSLLPRAEARIFIRVPLLIRVEVELPGAPAPTLLRTLPTLELSDTWWGGFLKGEPCSWLPTTARREVTDDLLEPHLVICPMALVNQSRSDLRVEKLCLRVEHLSLYADRRGFWADESRVRYHGDAEGSQIDMSGQPPEEATSPVRISAPPAPVRGIRALTFSRLLGMSGAPGSP
jgi:hypothetical protein